MSYQDFSTWTEYDPAGRLTVSTGTLTLTNYSGLNDNQGAYVYRTIPTSSDFTITFKIVFTSTMTNDGTTNKYYCPLWVHYFQFELWPNFSSDMKFWDSSGASVVGNTYYAKVQRTGTSLVYTFYTDSARTNSAYTKTFTISSTAATLYVGKTNQGRNFIGTTISEMDLGDLLGEVAVSGGVAVGGSAPGALSHAEQVSCGVSVGGSAPGALSHAEQVSGGVSISGSSPGIWFHEEATTGGVSLAGAAECVFPPYRYEELASGGFVIGGEVTQGFVTFPTVSGGIAGGGTGASSWVLTITVSGGAYLGGAVSPTVKLGASLTILSDLYQWLIYQEPVLNSVSDRIYPNEAPQSAAYPFVVYSLISQVGSPTIDGSRGAYTTRVQFDSYSLDYDEVNTISKTLRQALDGQKLTLSKHFCIVNQDSELESSEANEAGTDSWVNVRTQDFMLRWNEI